MMDYDEVNKVVQKLAKLAFMSDNRCRYLVEMLEPDQWVVNCMVTEECGVFTAEGRAHQLARIVERVLNEWYPPVERGFVWRLYVEPNYWSARGAPEDDPCFLTDGGRVQWCIYKERG